LQDFVTATFLASVVDKATIFIILDTAYCFTTLHENITNGTPPTIYNTHKVRNSCRRISVPHSSSTKSYL